MKNIHLLDAKEQISRSLVLHQLSTDFKLIIFLEYFFFFHSLSGCDRYTSDFIYQAASFYLKFVMSNVNDVISDAGIFIWLGWLSTENEVAAMQLN